MYSIRTVMGGEGKVPPDNMEVGEDLGVLVAAFGGVGEREGDRCGGGVRARARGRGRGRGVRRQHGELERSNHLDVALAVGAEEEAVLGLGVVYADAVAGVLVRDADEDELRGRRETGDKRYPTGGMVRNGRDDGERTTW